MAAHSDEGTPARLAPPAGGPPRPAGFDEPLPLTRPRSATEWTAIVLAATAAALRALQVVLQLRADEEERSWFALVISVVSAIVFAWATLGMAREETSAHRRVKSYGLAALGHTLFSVLGILGLLIVVAKYGTVFDELLAAAPLLWAGIFLVPVAVVVLHIAGALVTSRARRHLLSSP